MALNVYMYIKCNVLYGTKRMYHYVYKCIMYSIIFFLLGQFVCCQSFHEFFQNLRILHVTLK